MEVVIPTKNDYLYLQRIIEILEEIDSLNFIHIIDNCSDILISEKIRKIANLFDNVIYYFGGKLGKGNAIKLGVSQTEEDVLFLDADIENLSKDKLLSLINKFNEGYDLVKASFVRANGQSNSSFVLNDLRKLFPDLRISRPTGGIYITSRELLDEINIPNSWNVDLSILLQAYKLGFKIAEIDIGILVDKPRSGNSLSESKSCLKQEIFNFGGNKNGIRSY
ncbi:glycosyltransferase family 2 protein [Candidatus Woesearchaeota archaeon]|nr:glycosyltransferase family 2 protein [Candidatus Woesearchaeota archaeon]